MVLYYDYNPTCKIMRIAFKRQRMKKEGFTLIELLMVIAIVGVLSSVVLISLMSGKGKARDGRRMNDLDQIRKALQVYYSSYGTYMGTGSGCGSGGNGNGWFNYSNPTSYPISMAQCLINTGLATTEIIDPTGGRTSTPASGFSYMKYTCAGGTFIYAKLESRSQSSTATDGTCCSLCDTNYGMNYVLKAD